VPITCEACGGVFEARPSQNRKFCGSSCSNILKNQRNKKKGTDIENAVEAYLTAQGKLFQKQVNLHGITVADFVVGKTVIQCDGRYWHTLPGRAEKDREQDRKLTDMGYAVFRISDEELKQASVAEVMNFKSRGLLVDNAWSASWQDSDNSYYPGWREAYQVRWREAKRKELMEVYGGSASRSTQPVA
jgi:very-short-patch-repair endonuclease